jgi:predicted nuclease of restriction endonuclease-like (RecB) superfamily
MLRKIIITKEYQDFISSIKKSVLQARNIAVRKVNSELINLYYLIGKEIFLKQKETGWGDNLIGQIEKDLKEAFPDMSGFSRTNLFYMKKFFGFFGKTEKVPQLVGQIPWGHIRLILDKIKDKSEAIFYIQKTIENSWSRVILEHQIELNLYARQGKLQSNFDTKIEKKDLNDVKEAFKENYILDFLQLEDEAKEKDLEKSLIKHISHFILEFGKGFAFIGQQHKLTVDDQEFFIDLLFYNYILKRFVVVELKTTEFKPEYIGQIGFYITVVDRDIKTKSDKGTIGLIICKSKNKTVVEYALANSNHPTGVAEYKLSELPADIVACFPSEEEIIFITDHCTI